MKLENISAGSDIFKAYSPIKKLYFIYEGTVQIDIVTGRDKERGKD